MEAYSESHASAGDRTEQYYPTSSNTMAHLQQEENMMNMNHNMASDMQGQGGMVGQQDPRPHEQMNQSFQNSTPLPHHLNNAVHMQGGHVPMGQIPLHYDPPDGSGSARKRSKVSRACDECRRKKIKCDAQSEEGPCSNCRRSTVECQFSRVPQKRGPSKGYINALEKRVRALEHTSHDAMFDGTMGGGPNLEDVLSSAREEFGGRKRSFSNINSAGEMANVFQQQQSRPLAPESPWNTSQSTFPANQPIRQSPQQSSSLIANEDHNFARPSYTIHDAFPIQQTSQASDVGRHIDSYSTSGNVTVEEPTNNGLQGHVIDERALDGYYNCIHPSLPILSDSRVAVFAALAACPSMLVEAFYSTLHAAVSSTTAPDLSQSDSTQSQIAADLLNRCELAEPLRNFQARLVHIQALILMTVEAQSRTHNPAVRQVGGSLSKWLTSAVNNAFDMKLHLLLPPEGNDVNEDMILARRIWISLCVLDRLSSHSTGDVIKISEDYFTIRAQDMIIVGEVLFTIARLTSILGLMAQMNAHENVNADVEAPFSYGFFPKRLLDSWELDHPSLNSPLVHIMYWHVKLLVALDIKTTPPKILQVAAVKIMEFFAHADGLASPFLIYNTGLLVLVLVEMLRYEHTKHDGQRSLKLLREKAFVPQGWEPIIRKLTDAINPPDAIDETETSDLRRLANVAIAETERGREGERSENDQVRLVESSKQWSINDFKDLRTLARYGFMNAFNPNR